MIGTSSRPHLTLVIDPALPASCPHWCAIDHAQVLAETGDAAAAQEHSGHLHEGDLGRLWDLRIRQDSQPAGAASLELQVGPTATRHLTSDQARALAHQLARLADALELATGARSR